MPLFTVVIPTHDHEDLILTAVASVTAQTVQDFEIFVVGDGVTPATRRVIEEMRLSVPQLSFYDLPKEPRRCALNRHAALEDAGGTYVCYLDDDDIWFPEHLEVMREVLADADFAHTRLLAAYPSMELRVWVDDLGDPRTQQRMLDMPYNFLGPSHTGHRLSAYRKLPEGWSPPCDDTWNDLNMWRKFLRFPGMRFRSDRRATSFHLPSSSRIGWSLEQRRGELRFWQAVLAQRQIRDRLDRFVGFCDRGLGVGRYDSYWKTYSIDAERAIGLVRDEAFD
jgi:glycosyltransferase involved in cell wall biosynthesis